MSIDFSMKECGGIRLFSIGPLSKGALISQLISNDSSTFQTILRAGRPVLFVSRAEPSTSQLAASSVCTLPHAINDSHAPPFTQHPFPPCAGGVFGPRVNLQSILHNVTRVDAIARSRTNQSILLCHSCALKIFSFIADE